MKEKRVLAVILAVTLFFSGCGKSDEQGQNDVSEAMTDNIIDDGDTSEEQQEKHDISTLKVSYDQNDGLNPYEVKSQLNSLLTPLIFDGLVKVGTNFKAFNCIAREITKQGNIVTVKLESDATFSDNSKVTADDVIASFDAAKASSTKYAFNLKKVSSAKKISDDTIAFELSEDSKNYQNLFNFPIIKTNNGDVIGCGRYVFVKNPNGSYLEKSKYNGNYSEKNYPVEKIELVEADGKSSPSFKINMNEIDISYNKIELKNDKAVTLPYVLVPTNDLIYIGVNSQVGYMSNNQFKQGIFSSLDVSKIGVYVSLREEDFGNSFLNPQFYKAQPQKQNLIEAKKTFEALGYKSLKAGEIRIGADKKPVSLKLLINEENKERNMMAQEIKRQLLDVGIDTEIVAVPFDTYKSKLRANDFDLYIGEIGLSDDLDLSPVLHPSELSGYGTTQSSASFMKYQKYAKGEIGEKELTDMLTSDIPFIPIAYGDALLYHKRNFVSDIVATTDDIFYNILNWKIE